MDFIVQPHGPVRLGDFLLDNLRKNWSVFRAAIAFVKQSGTRHIKKELTEFCRHAQADIIVGVDHLGTSKEGLEDLLQAIGQPGKLTVFHNAIASTFHPKIYMFRSDQEAQLLVGSGNMTEGGLFTNYEASVHIQLDLTLTDHQAFLTKVETALNAWSDVSSGTAHHLNTAFLTKLVANGYVPVESMTVLEGGQSRRQIQVGPDNAAEEREFERLFLGRSVPRAPARAFTSTRTRPARPRGAASAVAGAVTPAIDHTSSVRGFVMTLHQGDVGFGQTTQGASQRSPELFIPLAARNMHPEFWGWPNAFVESVTKYDRPGVLMEVGGTAVSVNMMGWKAKHDLRLRSAALRSAGSVGSIIVIEKLDIVPGGAEYLVQFVPPGAALFPIYSNLCNQLVRNSKVGKRFGYY